MKYFLLLLSVSGLLFSCALKGPCTYGVTDCGPNKSCVQINQKEAACRDHSADLPEVLFPMSSSPEVSCDQGNLAPAGSTHTYNNTAFALDLMSKRTSLPAIIRASADGQVIAYDKCTTKNDQCGNGFGNYVQLLNEDGHLYFYAHLDKVIVKTGELIKQGQDLGVEGNTGWTGENNRHLHFSVHYDWRKMGRDYFRGTVGHLPDSVPFKMNVCQLRGSECTRKFTDSRKIECTRTTKKIEWLKVL